MNINRCIPLQAVMLAIALISINSGYAWGASIGVYSSEDCSSCNLDIPIGETRTLYINVLTTGLEPFNVTGGVFSVSGLPALWTTSIVEDQSALILGDPFEDSGVEVTFFAPRSGPCVSLLSVEVTATSVESEKVMSVTETNPLLSPSLDCPIVKIDCVFCVPHLCASGGSLFLNSSSGCTVSVADHTWSVVKQLFH